MGLNYFDHAKKAARTVLTIHGFSCVVRRRYKAMDSLRSAPVWSTTFDYEVELAVIIGKTMRQATQETALRYSAFDDMSLYDYQRKTPQ